MKIFYRRLWNDPAIFFPSRWLRLCPDDSNAGVEVQELQTLGEGEAKYFYFQDPEGNLLEAAWSKWDEEDEIKEHFKS
ncbi:hypothetical protein ACTHPF_13785 [Paenibacillus sp. SAF-054]